MNPLITYKNNFLHFGPLEKNINSFLKNYEGPIYVYDLELLTSRFQEMKHLLSGYEIYFAMKANPHTELLKTIKKLGGKADVVSQGEIKQALNAGFLPHDIVFSGVGKTRAEIEFAVQKQIHQINVESIPELERIIQICTQLNLPISIALRLNPNISIKTHPYIATGLQENKFGIDLSQLHEATTILQQQSLVQLCGISIHLGSQMHELSGLQLALETLKPIFLDLQSKFRNCNRFDVGGGLGIFYEKTDLEKESQLLANYAKIISNCLSGVKAHLQTEPGRWLVAHSGLLICQVQYIKKTPYKEFVILDSGMNHLMRPSLYQAYHQIVPLQKHPHAKLTKYDFVGPICESSDFFAKDRECDVLKQGDFVAILDVGAYGASMASTYNLHKLPLEIVI